MKFDELDSRLRGYETAHDLCILPEIFMVARIDGRNFTRLTKDVYRFEVPYDIRFRDYMVKVVEHLMTCGFKVIYGYTQSDEISLLFHCDENIFSRKLRKFNSVLAAEASAKFSLQLGGVGAFDCRISQLPTVNLVIDYFRWRHEDAHRNALNAHNYWLLRKEGLSPQAATEKLHKCSVAEKNELLFQKGGINFNDIPAWQKRGIGIYWEDFQKESWNPKIEQIVYATRKRLKVNMDLPMKDKYSQFINELIVQNHSELGTEIRVNTT